MSPPVLGVVCDGQARSGAMRFRRLPGDSSYALRRIRIGRAADGSGPGLGYLRVVGRTRAIDLGLAAGVFAVGEFSILAGYTQEGPRALTACVALVVCVALAVRRDHAIAAALVAMAAWLVQAIAAR